jgi:uracil-DNA glycosylase family 4
VSLGNYVRGEGPIEPKIAFIGEAPGEVEESQGKPFVGPAGGLLWEICSNLNLKRGDVYVTNILKHRPPNNDFGRTEEDVDKAVEFLKQEIAEMNPNIVVMFGGNVIKELLGKKKITDWRGSILWWHGRKAIPTLHPAYVLHAQADMIAEDDEGETPKGEIFKYWMKYLIQFDIARAIKHSESREHRPPPRLIQICNTYYDLYNFVNQQDTSEMAADIEALRGTCMPITTAISFSSSRAMAIPLYSEIAEKPTGVRESDLPHIWTLLAQLYLDPKIRKIGQNWKYDEDKINRLGFFLDKLWIDTSFLAHTLYPEFWKRLAFLTSVFTEEVYYKDDGKLFDPRHDDIKVLLKYNGLDACVTKEVKDVLYKEAEEEGMLDFFFNVMMPCHSLYIDMEHVGFHVDEGARVVLAKKYAAWSARNHAELSGLLGYELNCNSPKQVSHTIYETLKLPLRTGRGRRRTPEGGTGEQVLSQLLANVVKKEKDRRVIELILKERRVRKTLGPQYLLARPDYDGRIKSTWNICGTETGRTSTKMLKPPVRPEKMGISFQTYTKHGDIGGDLRLFLISKPGTRLVQIDSEQAEARVCMVLAEDYESLELMKTIDIHALTASWVFGGDWYDHSKKKHGYETPERFIGKTCRHSGHLDIRKGEFARNVTADARKYGIDIGLFSEYRAGKVLDIFHTQCPRVRSVFHEGVINALQDNERTLVAPHGRRRTFYERWGRELWKEAFAQLPQATVTDNTKLAMIELKKEYRDIEFIGESHDSMLFQRGEDWEIVAARAKVLMERSIDFSKCTLKREFQLVIPAEVEMGMNYKELKKVKL